MLAHSDISATEPPGTTIHITCVTSNADVRNLARRSSHFKDIKVYLRFLNCLSELTEEEIRTPDILIIEIRGTADEEQFFKLLHESGLANREIFILCTGSSAKEWHTFVMEREITDYLTIRPLHDPNRLRIQLRHAVERCSIRHLLRAAMRGKDQSSTGKILRALPTANSPFAFFKGIVEYARSHGDFLSAMFGVATTLEKMKKASAADTTPESSGVGPHMAEYEPAEHNSDSNRVLIIENDNKSAKVMKQVLEQKGYEVVHEASLDPAILKHEHGEFAAAVIDLAAPGVEGPQGIRFLQTELLSRRTPVLVSSCRSEDELVREVAGLGVSGYLLKPIDPQRFAQEIDAIEQSRATVQTEI